jgi:hypothetical protein
VDDGPLISLPFPCPFSEWVTSVERYWSTLAKHPRVTAVTSFSNLAITATETEYSAFAFTIAGMVDDYLPGTIGIYSEGWSSYIDLYLTGPLTSAGGSHSFSAGYDCPGCAVLPPNSDGVLGAEVYKTAKIEALLKAPEPGFYSVFAIGLAGLGFAVRGKRAITRA